ncbi:diaminopimelate decarboxylase [Rhodovibrionaceae bacterium A322]
MSRPSPVLPASHGEEYQYRNGLLHVEDVPLDRLAAEVGSPCFVYSSAGLERTYRRFSEALKATELDISICYAIKANPHQAVIQTFAALGAGADVVSEGELRRALAAGIPASKVVFAGVGKTRDELAFALQQDIKQFNVESAEELKSLSEVAVSLGKTATVVLRINPHVDARTHAKITTGKSDNKFGINIDQAPAVMDLAQDLPGLNLEGFSVHIGSQLTELEPFEAAYRRVAELFTEFRDKGYPLQHLDLGGGLGIAYEGQDLPTPEAYAAMVKRTLGNLGVPLVVEPGRYLVGDCGLLVSRVVYVKEGSSRRFVIVDAAMNDLIRPTLYEAWHDIAPVTEPAADASYEAADIVGPICESGDYLALQRPMPPLATDDLLTVFSTGAYGATMASAYNSRRAAPEVMVRGDSWSVISQRPTFDEMIAKDLIPDWLSTGAAAD